MAWIKLHDGFLDHPKFLEVGPLAGYLNVCAIAWANRNRTDGKVPRKQVPRLANFDDFAVLDDTNDPTDERVSGWRVTAYQLAGQLEEAGLWEWDAALDAYRIHDYLDHQKSAAEIQQLSTMRAESGKRGGDARQANLKQASSNGQPNAKQTPSKRQAEVRSKKEETTTPPYPPKQGGRKRDRDSFEENLKAFTAEHFPGVNPGYVGDAAGRLRARGVEPTVEALRPLVEQWTAP